MDDLDLDRELRAVLGSAPSPDFVSRVRARIAQAPPPSFFAGWIKPAAAIACAMVIVGVALPRDYGRTNSAKGPSVVAALKPGATVTPDVIAGLNPSPTSTQTVVVPTVVVPTFRSAKRGTARASTVEPPLPEVIIAPEDVEALRQFITSASEVRFVASFDPTPAPIPWRIDEPVEHNN